MAFSAQYLPELWPSIVSCKDPDNKLNWKWFISSVCCSLIDGKSVQIEGVCSFIVDIVNLWQSKVGVWTISIV